MLLIMGLYVVFCSCWCFYVRVYRYGNGYVVEREYFLSGSLLGDFF